MSNEHIENNEELEKSEELKNTEENDLVEILMALELDDDDEEVYRESFKVSREVLDKVLAESSLGFDDVDEFLSMYDPDYDGLELYEILKVKGYDVEKEVYDLFKEENDEDDEDMEGFDNLDGFDDLDEEKETEEEEPEENSEEKITVNIDLLDDEDDELFN